ncbi:hypothetical protein TRIUR3_03427 [Triticum urartu]|uniref:Uncharacterized protein n=1 Tax=Triticum urartu TaxID=4572 RepID=M8ABX7_TRIUA|nr:hypothetical protein TRIUR3_03427 [Triticum urartu]
MAQPLMTFIFGDVIDAFGSAASSRDVLHRVTKRHPGKPPAVTVDHGGGVPEKKEREGEGETRY